MIHVDKNEEKLVMGKTSTRYIEQKQFLGTYSEEFLPAAE